MIQYGNAYWKDIDNVLACVPGLEELSGRSVLIAGGTGMICSSVVDLLLYCNIHHDLGVQIILAGRSEERTRSRFDGFAEGKDYFFLPFDAVERDIETQIIQDVKADYIIDGASNADPAVLASEPVETILANLNGLYQLLEAAHRGRSRRLLYISSSEVYGNRFYQSGIQQEQDETFSPQKEEPLYDEEDYGYIDILNPRSSYPYSKRAAETLCSAYDKEYGLDFVIVRPGHIYGPSITDNDSRASAQFTREASAGRDIVLKSAGKQRRSYCYSLDCASAILTVLLAGNRGNSYNIANRDSNVTIREVAEAFAKAGGSRVIIEEASEKEKEGYNLMKNSSLNAEKLEALGWQASFGLEEGVRRTLEFYRLG